MTESTATQAKDTPGIALRFARHLVGISALLAINPFHGALGNWVGDWLTAVTAFLLICAALWGLYALFFTARARKHWPRSFFILLCVLGGLVTLGQWQEYSELRSKATTEKTAPQPDWESGVMIPPKR